MQAAFEQEGMTLIEVLISLAILVLIAAYFLTAITSGTSWISKAGKTTQAVNVASAIIEDIKANANRINAGTYSDNMLNIRETRGDKGTFNVKTYPLKLLRTSKKLYNK